MIKSKAKIAILATGGTIAGVAGSQISSVGYTAGVVGVKELIEAVPEIENLAQIQTKQVANIDSSNMNDEIWLKSTAVLNKASMVSSSLMERILWKKRRIF